MVIFLGDDKHDCFTHIAKRYKKTVFLVLYKHKLEKMFSFNQKALSATPRLLTS
jgi:hypothetical protein